ncbi:MAG: hypothetical protein HY721_16260 [Planctomycetes bacterium]|nr:hypothetical protein [Planctomycetota bacterium]
MALLALAACGCASGPPAWHAEREDLLGLYADPSRCRPALVVDIDDTLVDGGAWSSLRLACGLAPARMAPFAGAPEALRALAERWDLVLLTARDDSFAGRTVGWLAANGFPPMPVVFSRRLLFTERARAELKSAAIRALRDRGLRIERGIGDKPGDVLAYGENGLESFLIADGPGDPDLAATFESLGIRCLEPSALAAAGLGAAFLSRERCWPEIAKRLVRDRLVRGRAGTRRGPPSPPGSARAPARG